MKTSEPIPAARSPGASISEVIAPPMPAISMRRKAAGSGDPSRVLIAAKLPAAPMSATACDGASRLSSRTAPAASPPPSAIRGASGPRTAPNPSVTSAARATPTSSTGVGTPRPARNPSAGVSPPWPGRYLTVRATSTPPATRTGTGHHAGEPRPRAFGRSTYIHPWRCVASCRNQYDASATGAPMRAATTRIVT